MSSAMHSNPDPSLVGHGQSSPVESTAGHVCRIPPMVVKSQEAFRRALPELLKSRYRWWVAYHGDERIGFAKTETELYKECFRRAGTEDRAAREEVTLFKLRSLHQPVPRVRLMHPANPPGE